MKTYADARLGTASAPSLITHVHATQLSNELAMFDAFMEVDLAHTVMLAEERLITAPVAADILRGLLELRSLGPEGLAAVPERGSLLLQVEHWLADKVGEDSAGLMHLARSRIDQGAAVNRVHLRNRQLEVAEKLLDFQAATLELARRGRSAVMPGYSHLQHAQPWVLGHYMLAQFDSSARDFDRILETYRRTNLNSLGTAALAGTSWAVNRDTTTRLLGHLANVRNSKDAGVFAMDVVAENASVLALLMSNLGRLASDLYTWSTWEFRLVELHASLCSTSSIMPQKKNPYALERVRALAGEATGWGATQLGLLKLSSSSDGDEVFSTGQSGTYFDGVRGALELMTDVLETLEFDEARMEALAGVNWSCASELATLIVRSDGLDFRRAHEIVGHVVRSGLAAGKSPKDVIGDDVAAASEQVLGRPIRLSDEDIQKALDAREFVASRRSAGGVSPAEVDALTTAATSDLQAARDVLDVERRRVDDARRDLDTAARSLSAA